MEKLKSNYYRNQVNLNDYQNINYQTSEIIQLIYDTIIETEYNNDEEEFHYDMKINNKKILIIDGTCKFIRIYI